MHLGKFNYICGQMITLTLKKMQNSNNYNGARLLFRILLSMSIGLIIVLFFCRNIIKENLSQGNYVVLAIPIVAILILAAIISYFIINEIKESCERREILCVNDYKKRKELLEKEYKEKSEKQEKEMEKHNISIALRESKIKRFIESLDKEKCCAEMIADMKTMVFENSAKELLNRRYSAPSAAEQIRLLRQKARGYLTEAQYLRYTIKDEIEKGLTTKKNEYQEKIEECEKTKQDYYSVDKLLSWYKDEINKIVNGVEPFKSSASLMADIESFVTDGVVSFLREKRPPANSTAKKIEKTFNQKTRMYIEQLKEMKYKFDFLLGIYPQMNDYIYEDDSLISMADMEMEDVLNGDYDHTKEYLSDDEWNRLSKTERYQMALDRYKERRRSNAWVAGVEYEMYCSYLLRKNGFHVIEHGVNMRKADLGRDIIAMKNGNTYIIQCKRYSLQNRDGTDRFVHENVICQLYGTTIEYKLANPNNTLFANLEKVIPVLYTTGQLSDTANAFAKQLNVRVVNCQMGDYPMIKCNKNNGQQIFHLPFDQQYWNTIIDTTQGEFYAWTVQEAEDAGFKRAYRWRGNA